MDLEKNKEGGIKRTHEEDNAEEESKEPAMKKEPAKMVYNKSIREIANKKKP